MYYITAEGIATLPQTGGELKGKDLGGQYNNYT